MPLQTLESKPVQVDAIRAAQGVFLSPRVVDARAFDAFASDLRDLLEVAAARAAQITRATETSHQCAEQSGKMVLVMQDQLGKLEPALEEARELSAQLQSLREQMQQREQDARDAQSALGLRICEAEQRRESISRALDNGLTKLDALGHDAPVTHDTSELDGVLERLSTLEALIRGTDQSPALTPSTDSNPLPMQEHAALRETIDKIEKERELATQQLEEARALRQVLANAKQRLAESILKAVDATDRAEAAADRHEGYLASVKDSGDSLSELLKQSNEVHARLERTLDRAGKP